MRPRPNRKVPPTRTYGDGVVESTPLYRLPKWALPGWEDKRYTQFNAQDDLFLIDYMAKTESKFGKTTRRYFVEMYNKLKFTDPWILRHPPSSWQNRYVRNRKKFDDLLETYLTDPHDPSKLSIFPPPDQLVLQADKRIALQWMAKKEHLMHPTTLTHPVDDDREYLKPGDDDPEKSGKLERVSYIVDAEDHFAMRRYVLQTYAKQIGVSESIIFQMYQALSNHWRSLRRCCEIMLDFAEKEGITFEQAIHILMKEIMELQSVTTTYNPQSIPHVASKLTKTGLPFQDFIVFGNETHAAELRV